MKFLAWAVMAFALLSAAPAVAATTSTQQNIDAINKKIAVTTDEEVLAGLYAVRGDQHVRLKEYAKAVDDYTLALNFLPETPSRISDVALAHYRRGNAYSHLQAPDKAIEDIDAAIRLWPTNTNTSVLANAYLTRASIRSSGFTPIGQKSIFQQADTGDDSTHQIIVDDLTTALKLWPDDDKNLLGKLTALQLRGKHYALSGQRKLALKDYDEALILFPISTKTIAARDDLVRDMMANGESLE